MGRTNKIIKTSARPQLFVRAASLFLLFLATAQAAHGQVIASQTVTPQKIAPQLITPQAGSMYTRVPKGCYASLQDTKEAVAQTPELKKYLPLLNAEYFHGTAEAYGEKDSRATASMRDDASGYILVSTRSWLTKVNNQPEFLCIDETHMNSATPFYFLNPFNHDDKHPITITGATHSHLTVKFSPLKLDLDAMGDLAAPAGGTQVSTSR